MLSTSVANNLVASQVPGSAAEEYCPRCRAERVFDSVFCHACGFRFPLTRERQQVILSVAHACRTCGCIDTVGLGAFPADDSLSDHGTGVLGPARYRHLLTCLPPVPARKPRPKSAFTVTGICGMLTIGAFVSWIVTLLGGRLVRESTANIAWFCLLLCAGLLALAVLNVRLDEDDREAEFAGAVAAAARARAAWGNLVYCPRCEYLSNCSTGETAPADTPRNLFS